MREEITIEFRGRAAIGKSTMAQEVANHLGKLGFDVQLNDHDHPAGVDEMSYRLASLVKKDRQITINAMADRNNPISRESECCV